MTGRGSAASPSAAAPGSSAEGAGQGVREEEGESAGQGAGSRQPGTQPLCPAVLSAITRCLPAGPHPPTHPQRQQPATLALQQPQSPPKHACPAPRTCSASFAAVLVHTEMRSCLGRTLTTMPHTSSPSSNCSPMQPSTPCSHIVSSSCLLDLGTMTVHLPPCSQRGSSHLGSTPSRNRCRSEPGDRREGGIMLLYRLRYGGRAGQGQGGDIRLCRGAGSCEA